MIFTQIDQTYQIRFRNYNIFLLKTVWLKFVCRVNNFLFSLPLCDYIHYYLIFWLAVIPSLAILFLRRVWERPAVVGGWRYNWQRLLVPINTLKHPNTKNTTRSVDFLLQIRLVHMCLVTTTLKMNRNFTSLIDTVRFFSVFMDSFDRKKTVITSTTLIRTDRLSH